MADKIVQIKQKNGEGDDNLIPQKAQTSDYPTGFTARRSDEIEWGVQTGTLISCWDVEATDSLGSIAFRKDCPENGKVSMVIDGTVYVNEGKDRVFSGDLLYSYEQGTAGIENFDISKIESGDKLIIDYGIIVNRTSGDKEIYMQSVFAPIFDVNNNILMECNIPFHLSRFESTEENPDQFNVFKSFDIYLGKSTSTDSMVLRRYLGSGLTLKSKYLMQDSDYSPSVVPLSNAYINSIDMLIYKVLLLKGK